MSRKWSILAISVILLVSLAAAVTAAQEVDRRLPADPEARVTIENVSGSVEIIGTDQGEVHVTGTLSADVKELRFEGDPDDIRIEVVLPEKKRHIEGDADLRIEVPRQAKVRASTVSAGITARGVTGQLDLQSISGDVDAEGKPQEAEAESISGEVRLRVNARRVSAKAISGDLRLTGIGGELSASTVSGDLIIEDATVQRLDCESVSGDITFAGKLRQEGPFSFNSHSGDVGLQLSGDLDAEFDISTFSGEIETRLGSAQVPAPERKSKYTPGKELRFEIGKGRARVEIDTFSGDVTIAHE
jgi:DUF4097 and DUF4098 domain-containing protein YvlB